MMASVMKDVVTWLRTWFHTKDEITALLNGKANSVHSHTSAQLTENSALSNLETSSGASQHDINVAINSKIGSGGGSTGGSSLACLTDLDVDALNEQLFITGCDGKLITGVEKTGTSGNVDTYTITFSDDSTFPFTVTNATDGAVAHSHGYISNDGTLTADLQGSVGYPVGWQTNTNKIGRLSFIMSSMMKHNTQLPNIGLNSLLNTQGDINVAINNKFANISYNDLLDKPNIPSSSVVDTSLDGTSTHPVQNKVIYSALQSKLESSDVSFGLDSANEQLYMEIS